MSIMGLKSFCVNYDFCDFDDEFCALNSCVIMGMLSFIKLVCYVLKIHSCYG